MSRPPIPKKPNISAIRLKQGLSNSQNIDPIFSPSSPQSPQVLKQRHKSQSDVRHTPNQRKERPPVPPKPSFHRSSLAEQGESTEDASNHLQRRRLSFPSSMLHTKPNVAEKRTACRIPPPKPPRIQSQESLDSIEMQASEAETEHENKNEYELSCFESESDSITGYSPEQGPMNILEHNTTSNPESPKIQPLDKVSPTNESQNSPTKIFAMHTSLPITMESSFQRLEPLYSAQSKTQQRKETSNKMFKHYGFQKEVQLFKPMTLIELSKKYSKFFPLKIQIAEGHYGISTKYSISREDHLNIHFKKCSKEVVVHTYGQDYSIPLSSAIKFGLVYDPQNKETEAMGGYHFRRAVDLMEQEPLPKMVVVSSGCFCSNGVTIDRDEILVIRKVKKKVFRGKRILKVFSMSTLSKKNIPEETIGNFSTRSICLQAYLSQLIEYVPNLFPCKSMMYIDKEDGNYEGVNEDEFPPHMFSWPVILKEQQKQKSLVASAEGTQQLIDLPLHGNIAAVKAEIIPPHNPDEIEELIANTHIFLKQFDPSKVNLYRECSSESVIETQNTLYKIVRNSKKRLGVDMVTPLTVKKLESEKETLAVLSEAKYEKQASFADPENHTYETLPYNMNSDDEEYELFQPTVIRPQTTALTDDNLHNRVLGVAPITKENSSCSSDGTFPSAYKFMNPDRRDLASPLSTNSFSTDESHSPHFPMSEIPNITTTTEDNKYYLSTLDITQVLFTYNYLYAHKYYYKYACPVPKAFVDACCYAC